VLAVKDGYIQRARLALGGVGAKPWRVPEAEAALEGQAPDAAAFHRAAELVLRGARPQSENAFKGELARRCVLHALKLASTPG
jgi:xanthine dehydrogenase YagS FAD-binding subunit